MGGSRVAGLSNCPFCGRPAYLNDFADWHGCTCNTNPGFVVGCSAANGGCGASTGWCSTEAEAMNVWNRRVPEVTSCPTSQTQSS
jgi:hypothetical protein